MKRGYSLSLHHVSLYTRKVIPSRFYPHRWGTWLEAINYNVKYFDEFKGVIEKLDEQESKSIQNIRKFLNSHSINK